MSGPIKVMIVDDSVVIRRIVTAILSQDPGIKVVGCASNGKIAVEQIPILNPEVIVLDLEMPEMDGFGVLRILRIRYPKIKTVIFSTLSQRGASQTIEALSLGASDYASKPSSMESGNEDHSLEKVTDELVKKVKQLGPPSSAPASYERGNFRSPLVRTEWAPSLHRSAQSPKVVAVGISTGGPEALMKMIPEFSKSLPVPILIVQHMPPIFTKILSDRLASSSQIKVIEANDGMKVEKGTVYIAPGNYHMEVQRKKDDVLISLNQNPTENSCRPSADVLFRSVAHVYGSDSLGVIMTGMGQDGYKGLRIMKDKGGIILAQDEASSVVWGMPSYVVREGFADQIVSLTKMSAVIEDIVSRIIPSTAR